MIPVCIFTYSGDALPLRECVKGVLLAGLKPVVFDDAHHPIGRAAAAWVESLGGIYRKTYFKRRGNLNGTECAAGIARSMHQAMVETQEVIAFKIDTDTIILRPDRFLGNSSGVCSSTPPARKAFGCSYTLTKNTATKVAEHLETLDDPAAPEDELIWDTIRHLGLRHAIYDFVASGGPFSAVPKYFDPVDCMKFDVLTFGNPPEEGWKDRPLEITLAMKRLNDFNLSLGL
jgi:hypothetical protein